MDNSNESEAESQVPDSQKRFDFQLFKDQRKSYDPRASIRKQGQIAISAGAVRTYDLRKEPEDGEEKFGEMIYDYWTLHFDEDENVIGLRPYKKKVEGAKKARTYETGRYR